MHEGGMRPLSFFGELAKLRKVKRGSGGKFCQHLVVAMLEHVEEGGAPPVPGRITLSGRAVFDDVTLVARHVAPAEAAPLIDRMQRIDQHERAREFQSLGAAALTEPSE